jgi:hypothetical protein
MNKALIFGVIIIILIVVVVSIPPSVIEDKNLTIPDEFEPRGDRILGIAASDGSLDFETAYSLARDAGMQYFEYNGHWDNIEIAPYEYGDEWVDIINLFYGSQDNMQISFSVNTYDTNQNRIPLDLRDKPLTDPESINRYKGAVDYMFSRLTNVTIKSFSVGNEIDSSLISEAHWDEYIGFFREIKNYIKDNYPDVLVGSKITFSGLTGPFKHKAQELNSYADAVLTTDYFLMSNFSPEPPETVREHMRIVVEMYPDKEIYYDEIGYHSGTLTGSSEYKQAKFISEAFQGWDQYKDSIKLLNFVWLVENPKETVDEFLEYYGFPDAGFADFLGTLGYIRVDGSPKPAYNILKQEANRRGWVNN